MDTVTIEVFRQLYAEAYKVKEANGFLYKNGRKAHRDNLYYLILNYLQTQRYKEKFGG